MLIDELLKNAEFEVKISNHAKGPQIMFVYTNEQRDGNTRSDLIFNKLAAQEMGLKAKDRILFHFDTEATARQFHMLGPIKDYDQSFLFELAIKGGGGPIGLTNRHLISQMAQILKVSPKDFDEKNLCRLHLHFELLEENEDGVKMWKLWRTK